MIEPLKTGPSYYTQYKIQPVDFIVQNEIPFVEGCVITYLLRWRDKGTPLEDLKKAQHYLSMLVASQEAEEKNLASYTDGC